MEKAITERDLCLYPAVATPNDLTWDEVIRLSYHEPIVRHFVILAERGDITREQACIAAIFALYNQKAAMFRAEVDRRNMTATDFVMMGDKIYDRRT